jgi:hypothetical protein
MISSMRAGASGYANHQAGESIADLSMWLGHDDPGFTLRTYTHFLPGGGERGRKAMDAWMEAAA